MSIAALRDPRGTDMANAPAAPAAGVSSIH